MYTPHQLELLARLTSRERDVLWALMEHGRRDDIASDLNISVKTVDNHQAHIAEKWHLRYGGRWAILSHFQQPQREVA